jgi:V-type H+-transporting ATPase subunit d
MIDNVMLLLKGTLSGREVDELIEQCHPLGIFKVCFRGWQRCSPMVALQESTMRNIPSYDNTRGYADLYETVLVDTPVGEIHSA